MDTLAAHPCIGHQEDRVRLDVGCLSIHCVLPSSSLQHHCHPHRSHSPCSLCGRTSTGDSMDYACLFGPDDSERDILYLQAGSLL